MGELPTSQFPQLEQNDINFLSREVTNEEIKSVLFDMTSIKVLGVMVITQFSFRANEKKLEIP